MEENEDDKAERRIHAAADKAKHILNEAAAEARRIYENPTAREREREQERERNAYALAVKAADEAIARVVDKDVRDRFHALRNEFTPTVLKVERLTERVDNMKEETARIAKASETTAYCVAGLDTKIVESVAENKGSNRAWGTVIVFITAAIPILLYVLDHWKR